MVLLTNLRAAEPLILVSAWVFLFVAVPLGCVLAARFRRAR